ncbi:MAG: hypothetical protein HOP15_08555, partial [Planctomycetes bacterium]|nr:hypothetical protein [Planctomycetota bacterium]
MAWASRTFLLASFALVLAARAVEARSTPAPQEDELRVWSDFLGDGLSYFPRNLDSLSDVNGDGFREFLLGDPDGAIAGGGNVGTLYVLSGAAVPLGAFPTILRSHRGAGSGARFGQFPASLGDLDGDGVEEYACRSESEWFVFNGRDGRLLRRKSPTPADHNYGPLTPLGDLDRDGVGDFLGGGSVYSGRSITPLYDLPGDIIDHYFQGVFPLGDLDCDGVPDFVTSFEGEKCEYSFSQVRSGSTGAVLYPLPVDNGSDKCLPSATPVGDLDGDGCADFSAGSPPQFYGGQSGQLLAGLPAEDGFLFYPSGLQAGDLNGNGVPDVLAWSHETERIGDGYVTEIELWAFDGATREPLWRTEKPRSLLLAGRDWNGDGFPDFLAREYGERIVLHSGAPARDATAREPRDGVRVVGSPCRAEPKLRIGVSGGPFLGRRLPVHLSGVAPGRLAFLRVGALRSSSRCVLVEADAIFAARAREVSPGIGVATVEILLPASVALAGTSFGAQWILERARVFESSAALELQLGIGPRHPTTATGLVALGDGTPVAGAEVEIVGLGLRATTDAAGRFSVPEVAIQNRGVHV